LTDSDSAEACQKMPMEQIFQPLTATTAELSVPVADDRVINFVPASCVRLQNDGRRVSRMSLFAVIPAAGLSRRMGCSKLVLPLAGRMVIHRLLSALQAVAVDTVVIVLRRSDEELKAALADSHVQVVQPEIDPPDMRSSVEAGLAMLQNLNPNDEDGWLLIPADHPVLDIEVLQYLIAAWSLTDAEILLPEHAGRTGHPAFFRWSLTRRIPEIPADCGLNWLRRASGVRVQNVSVHSDCVLLDLDTPEDYRRLQRRYEESGLPGQSTGS